MLLKRLYMYPSDDFYGDDSVPVEGMEPFEVDNEEVFPPFIDPKFTERYCFVLKEENAAMPY